MEATDIFCSWHRLRRVPKIWPSRLCQRWGVRRLGCDPSSQGCTTAKSESHSVVPDSLQPHGLHSPWNSPGQNTGAGSLSLLQGISPTHGLKPRSPTLQADSLPTEPSDQIRSVAQSCPTLCNPMDYTVHGILQARILEWVAFLFSKVSSQPRDQTQVSCIAGRFFTS